jgi:cation:H+ antiporter
MDVVVVASLVGGVVALVVGAEWLVRGASTLASRLGIAPVVIGLTVVALGTSAPEMAVSVASSLGGNADVALGNVVGSNTFNILLILGLSAIVGGLAIEQRLLRRDIPLLIVISVVAYLMVLDGSVGRMEGVVLFAGIVAYTGWLIRAARAPEPASVTAEYEAASPAAKAEGFRSSAPFQAGLIVAGLALLVLGSRLLVSAATSIASALGVSDLVIGLTVVAAGTSLPELATSVLAAIRGQRDIAVGNVVGSNIFNLLSVLGASAAISRNGVAVSDEAIVLDFPVTLVAAAVLVPICWNGFMIKRWEGAVLVGAYVAYVAYLVFRAGDDGVPEFYRTMLMIVVPLALVAFSAAGVQGWRRHRAAAAGAR